MADKYPLEEEPRSPAAVPATPPAAPQPLQFLADVPLTLSVQFGVTTITLERLLKLTVGSVLELQSKPGEPVRIALQGKTVASGEVVVVNDKYGVRISEM
jgi:flagellar motor switch protein FliN/FliY